MLRRSRMLVLALVLGSALWLGCSTPEERFADHVKRGDEFAKAGDTQKALLEYHSALKIQPDHADLNERVGDLLHAQGASEDAAFFYREAYRLDPDNAAAAIKEARLVLFSDSARAEDILARIEKRNPNVPAVPRTRSEIDLLRGDLKGALAHAQAAVDMAPDDSHNWMQLAKVYETNLRQDQIDGRVAPATTYEQILGALDRAQKIEGGEIPALVERGRVLASWAGHREESSKAFRDALAAGRESGDPDVRGVAGAAVSGVARQLGDAELERDGLREIVAADDSKLDAWARLASVEEQLEPGAGEAIFHELLAKRAKDPVASTLYANFLISNDRGLDAIAHIEQVIADGVQAPVLWDQLLRLQLARLQIADARATLVRMQDAFPDDPLTRLAEARTDIVTRHDSAAAEILRALVTSHESYEAQRLLAVAEHHLGNLDQAKVAINRALVLSDGRNPPSALIEKAHIHHDAGEWNEVLATYEVLITGGHSLADSDRLRRARALYESARRQAGRATLVNLLSKDSPQPAAAVEYFRREGFRDPVGARAYLQKALENSPANFGVLQILTSLDVYNGKNEQALARLDKVIESRRVGSRVLLLRAGLHLDAGDQAAAEADALRAFENAPDSTRAIEMLLVIYRAEGKLDEARRSFEEAEAAGVLHAGARLLLGRLALETGDTARARELFEKVIEEQPDLAGARSELAFLLATQPDSKDRALELAEQAANAARKDPNVAREVGYVYLQTGRPEAAVEQLRHALGLIQGYDPTAGRPLTHYYLGLALKALDRQQEALGAFQKALALDAGFPNADDARREIEGIRAAADQPPARSS